MDALDRAEMFEDSDGVQATFSGSTDWGHLEDPTAELFGSPDLVDTDRVFVTDADGDLADVPITSTLTIGGTDYIVRAFSRDADGGLVRYLLADNT